MAEYIERGGKLFPTPFSSEEHGDYRQGWNHCLRAIYQMPAANVVEIPEEGIEFLSDGYHTFNSLYFQRLVLFAALVKAYKDRAWKSWKHEDGEPCFGGGWFIVGIDTPHGSYTYHYEGKYFDLFECEELPVAKHWDGHTEANVTRMLSLPDVVERPRWIPVEERLPRGGENVLAYYHNPYNQFIVCATWDSKRQEWIPDLESIDGYYITAWMPLPEPPKEDT